MIKFARIKQRLCSSQGQKISLTILMIGIFFFASTYAQTEATTETSKLLENTQYIIQRIIDFISRSWILLATLAGKFMSNDLVYGSWLHMDAYLWKLRNICKNFANFGLLGILLWNIIQFITKKTGSIQSIITKSVVAGVLIQASWFIVAALLDISTIATAALSSFPSNFIDSNAFSKETITKNIEESIQNHILKLDKEGGVSIEEDKDAPRLTTEELIEKIMPKDYSVSGPLVYIGATTLHIQDSLKQSVIQDHSLGKGVTTSLLQFLMIAIYCITLILLLITNIIRIGLLRVIIPLSPILVLMFSLGKSMGKDGLAKNFNIGTILNAIFKPAIFAGVLSLVLIFIVCMQNIMNNPNNASFSIQGMTIGVSGSVATMDINGLSTVNINDTVFTQAGNSAKNIFSNIIIYFATIFLLRYLVKIAATSGGGTIGKVMEDSTKIVENMAKTAPIIGGYSAGAYIESSDTALQNIGKTAGINLDRGSASFGKLKNEKYEKWLEEKLSGKLPRTSDDMSDLENAKSMDSFLSQTKEIISRKDKNGKETVPLSYRSSPDRFAQREALLNKLLNKSLNKEDKATIKKYFNKETTEYTVKNLNEEGFKMIHEKLGNTGTAPKTYEDFLKTSYGASE